MGKPGTGAPSRSSDVHRAIPSHRQSGFSYVALLIMVAIIGAASAAALSAGSAMQRRSAEDELLFIGTQFQDAFKTYYEMTPPGGQPHPERLEDLLLDRRSGTPRRHLRKIFADPLTGHSEWGIIKGAGSGIAGVYSLSTEHPVRVAGFELRFAQFENKQHYSEWLFAYTPPAVR